MRKRKWFKTKHGPWLEGMIDPDILRNWHQENVLDCFRQVVCSTIYDLTKIVYAQEQEIEKLKKEVSHSK